MPAAAKAVGGGIIERAEMMDDVGLYELVETILRGVRYIAFGGLAALIFFFIFAPHICGSKMIHKQLDNLHRQTEKLHEELQNIAKHLKDANEKKDKES